MGLGPLGALNGAAAAVCGGPLPPLPLTLARSDVKLGGEPPAEEVTLLLCGRER